MSMIFADGTVNFPQGIKVEVAASTPAKILAANTTTNIYGSYDISSLAINPANLTTFVPVSKGGTGASSWTTTNKLLKANSTTISESTISDNGTTTIIGASSGLSITATTASSATNNGALVVAGGVGIGGSLYVGATGSIVKINGTTNATSAASGALIVDGGIGVAKSIYIGTNLTVAFYTSFLGSAILANNVPLMSYNSSGEARYAILLDSWNNWTIAGGGVNVNIGANSTGTITIGNSTSVSDPVYIKVAGYVKQITASLTLPSGYKYLIVPS
jgi:hypothetical protein